VGEVVVVLEHLVVVDLKTMLLEDLAAAAADHHETAQQILAAPAEGIRLWKELQYQVLVVLVLLFLDMQILLPLQHQLQVHQL
jgi:hypothetical protein